MHCLLTAAIMTYDGCLDIWNEYFFNEINYLPESKSASMPTVNKAKFNASIRQRRGKRAKIFSGTVLRDDTMIFILYYVIVFKPFRALRRMQTARGKTCESSATAAVKFARSFMTNMRAQQTLLPAFNATSSDQTFAELFSCNR